MTDDHSHTPFASVKTRSSLALHSGKKNERSLLEEVPVSLVFDGTSAAVLMASPCDIGDLAYGFALTEGFISCLADVESFELVEHAGGIEARFWLKSKQAEALALRRRTMVGPIGCGLCGIDSIEQALRDVPRVTADLQMPAYDASKATETLRAFQPLHDASGAAHAAGFLRPDEGMLMAREDLGRHNALDKLIGALHRASINPASGALVMTSRLSLELVQKCAMAGCPMLIAVSAPTVRAVDLAEKSGMTLVGFARGDTCEVFSHPERIIMHDCP